MKASGNAQPRRRQFALRVTAVLSLFILGLGTFAQLPNAGAQNQPDLPSYWQYATSARLGHLAVADTDGDGVDEFIIADENNRVDLVDAGGKQVWSFVAPDRITSVAALAETAGETHTAGILVGIPNYLIFLSNEGTELWRTAVNPLDASYALRGGRKEADSQLDGYQFVPIEIAPFDHDSDGQLEIITLLQSGELLLYDREGAVLWQHTDHPSEGLSATPKMLIADLDQDGQDEIVLAIYDPRRFGQLVLIDNGLAQWDLSLSRQITDLAEITFEEGGKSLVAVGTSLGHVYTYDYARQRHWLRTLNTAITSLAGMKVSGQEILAVGTSAGTVVGFDGQGRRLWANQLAASPDKPVIELSAAPAALAENQPSLTAIVQSGSSESNIADAYLLDKAGEAVARINSVDAQGLTQLADSNRDSNGELLVAHFATLEMLGMGVGNSGNVKEWEYSLNAAPSAMLVANLDGDENEELVIGTHDGRIHNLNSDRSIRWLHDAGGAISHLAILPNTGDATNNVVIAGLDQQAEQADAAWLQVREPKGERIWEQALEYPVTALLVADAVVGGGPEIVIGNRMGEVQVYSSAGDLLYAVPTGLVGNEISSLLYHVDESVMRGEILAGAGNSIVGIDLSDPILPVRSVAEMDSNVFGLYPGSAKGRQEIGTWLLVLTSNGQLHGLNWRGVEMAQWQWPIAIGAIPTAAQGFGAEVEGAENQAAAILLAGTESGELAQVRVTDGRAIPSWQVAGLGDVTAVHGYDQNGDGQPDLVYTGSQEGKVSILGEADSSAPQAAASPLELASAVFGLETFRRDVGQAPDIVAATENGLVQVFRDQENRPPLLTNPRVESDGTQYSISVVVNDVEGDEVVVNLEVYDAENNSWLDQGMENARDGKGTLFWALPSPPAGAETFDYRFMFSDGSYRGMMRPPAGPTPAIVAPWSAATPVILAAAVGILAVAAIVFARQAQTANARAERIYRNLQRNPHRQLALFEQEARTGELQELMPYLASQARQENDRKVAGIAEGLFLLADQPKSGLPIVNAALAEMAAAPEPEDEDLETWVAIFSAGQELLEAPTLSDLILLRPRLAHTVKLMHQKRQENTALEMLQPILSSLSDSTRVSMFDDRLVYLNEASSLLVSAQAELPVRGSSLEEIVTAVILRRWAGLVSAEIEDLRGRAELSVVLKTRRVVPSEETVLAFEIGNNGRSPAELVSADLDLSPAYTNLSPAQSVQVLPPGHRRELRFTIAPLVSDRLRIGLTVNYSDRNGQDRTLGFGDMVHLLQPVRDFTPLTNPYTPGTALRPDSMIFFGRDDLFDFIAENAGRRSYRNVLILVGQRRTGKTSALLRLEDNLPDHLLPVYIDCQSLGVVPGMPALLEELAWYIADALGRHGIQVDVPELVAWQRDPTRLFQRRFLPAVNALLPEGTTLLLVFDEFEAFENLVADGILPATFFSYLRHLMQHGEQLNFIFVGTRRLEEMTSDYWSVLFNIALYRKIAFLDAESATRLITEPVAPELVYDDLALDKILRVTAGHPYFLQLVCYTLVKRANSQRNGYVTVSDVNAAVEEMLMLGEVHFAYLWQRSSFAEKALLTAVAHLMDQTLPFSQEELMQSLKPYAIHFGPAEVSDSLNSLVERDILREVPEGVRTLYELKLGLVALWVGRNKSLSKLVGSGMGELPPAHGREAMKNPAPGPL